MRVLVTGISGYIGTHLLRLLDRDPRVERILGLDIRPPLEDSPKLTMIHHSVTEPFERLFEGEGVTAAVHLAFVLNPIRDLTLQRQINVRGTAHFFAACARLGVNNVVLASSATAYGARPDNPVPLDEEAPLRAYPRYPYAFEKVLCENLAAAFAASHPGASVKIVRPTIVAGPTVSNFISRTMTGPLLPLVLGHDPPYQMVHELDVARAFQRILMEGRGGPYNVAPPDAVPLSELARQAGSRVVRLPYPLARLATEAIWRAGLTQLFEAPPGLLDFVMYPWVIEPRRLTEELGFHFDYDTRATLAAVLSDDAAATAA